MITTYLKDLLGSDAARYLTDAHYKKTDLKVFIVVIPKEGWARVAAPILLLV